MDSPLLSSCLTYFRAHGIPHSPPRELTLPERFQFSLLLAAAVCWRPKPQDVAAMADTINRLNQGMDKYEDYTLMELARSQIPLDTLRARAALLPHSSTHHTQDHFAHLLVKWFKEDYMKWVDPILCAACDGEKMTCVGQGEVSTQERIEGGAGRVELWQCGKCQRTERFPRFNDLKMLMKTRKGRCGEFANLFTLFLRAAGLRARYIWNQEDHVWNEYYSDFLGRWIHLDPCEGASAEPLLYTVNWNKTVTYIFGFSTTGCQDLTLGYVPSGHLPPGRTRILEQDLRGLMRALSAGRRSALGEVRRKELVEEDRREQAWMRDWKGRERYERERAEAKELIEGAQDTVGRESGTKEWKEQRGEAGEDEKQ